MPIKVGDDYHIYLIPAYKIFSICQRMIMTSHVAKLLLEAVGHDLVIHSAPGWIQERCISHSLLADGRIVISLMHAR